MNDEKMRKEWVDVLRAIAMLFVIYGHIEYDWYEHFVIVNPIKIPLFFAITGYVFNSKKPEGKFWKDIFQKMIIPWLILGLLPIALLTPLKGGLYFQRRFIEVITGKDIWYIPCCMIAEIIWYYICKLKRNIIPVVAVICFGTGLTLARLDLLNFFMINRAFVVQLYILIGFWFRNYEELFDRLNTKYIGGGCTLYILLEIISFKVFPGQKMDVHMNRYYHLAICLMLIYIGCFLAFTIIKRLKRYPIWLIYVGQNTLVIYICHGYVAAGINRVLRYVNNNYLNRISAVFVSMLVCGICCLIAYFINAYIPWLVGRKQNRRMKSGGILSD